MKRRAIIVCCFIALTISPAMARCYEKIGCTNSDWFDPTSFENFSCQILWEIRNSIYHENGYCFHTARALAVFPNDSCTTSDAGTLIFNRAETHNIKTIEAAERANGC